PDIYLLSLHDALPIWGEFAERSSYYGMRAILPLYLATVLHFPDNSPVYYWFKMAVYFLPLLGGFLADRFIGRYWAIVGFSVPYVDRKSTRLNSSHLGI